MWTIWEHTHGTEIRKRGLELDRAAKLLEVVDSSSSGMQIHFHVYVTVWLRLTFIVEQWSVHKPYISR
jgi:hypothetical protein